MSLPRYKATGQRGQWSARVEGEMLPCVHDFWVKRDEPNVMMYDDPGCDPDRPKWRKFIALLQTTKRAVLSQDKVTGKVLLSSAQAILPCMRSKISNSVPAFCGSGSPAR